jgi:predicted NAD-dependent protein-ADP-ribosyltransferase YbiA (DUF1768 family)
MASVSRGNTENNEAARAAENQAEADQIAASIFAQPEEEEEYEEDEEVEAENNDAEARRYAEELVAMEKPKTVRKRVQRKKRVEAVAALQTNPEITRFFEGRMIDPDHYTYTAEGNLEVKGVQGVPDKVIRMEKKFVKLHLEQVETFEVARKAALKTAEEEYVVALAALREAQEQYQRDKDTTSAEAVVLANKNVSDKSKIISRTAHPEIWTDVIPSIDTNRVLPQYDPYEKRKLGYPVYVLKHHTMPMKEAWGSYEERRGGDEEVLEGGGLRIRFITDVEDPNTGHFHPFYQRNFVFNETEYCCPYQAYQAERFKELGQEELRKQTMGTRSGRTMHNIATKNTGLPKTPQALWEDILFHFFHQHADLEKELVATGSDKFHVMDKQIPSEYGPALDKARLKLLELGDSEVADQEVKERAITEEQQKKDKVGAIIHNKFRKKF